MQDYHVESQELYIKNKRRNTIDAFVRKKFSTILQMNPLFLSNVLFAKGLNTFKTSVNPIKYKHNLRQVFNLFKISELIPGLWEF